MPYRSCRSCTVDRKSYSANLLPKTRNHQLMSEERSLSCSFDRIQRLIKEEYNTLWATSDAVAASVLTLRHCFVRSSTIKKHPSLRYGSVRSSTVRVVVYRGVEHALFIEKGEDYLLSQFCYHGTVLLKACVEAWFVLGCCSFKLNSNVRQPCDGKNAKSSYCTTVVK